MRTKILKIFVIVIAFIFVIFLNFLLRPGNTRLHPLLAIGLLSFTLAVWKWKPKNKDNDQDKHLLKKD